MYLLPIAAGVWFGLCWSPFGLAPMFPLALLLMLRALRRARTGRDALRVALLFGTVEYAVGASFFLALLAFSPFAIFLYLMVIAYILPYSILGFWGSYKLEAWFGLPRTWALMLLFPLLEKARTMGDTSFPADLISHAFGTHPSWLAWNSWIGPFGLSLLAFGVATLLDLAIEQRARRGRAVGLALLAAALWLGPPVSDLFLNRSPRAGPELQVGIVQPNVSVEDKLNRERWPYLWQRLEQLTLQAARGADLVIWPETSRPGALIWRDSKIPLADDNMQALADRVGVPILYGCEIARVEENTVVALYNGAALVYPGRRNVEWYGKQRLLPFVEGVPFAKLIGWDPSKRKRSKRRSYFTLMGNFAPGPPPPVFQVGPARIGALICFEGQYPWLGRRYRMDGANALLVITNDAWWGRSVFARWHAQMVASQARSLDLPVIRAANSGVSSATDRFGHISDSTDLFEIATLQVTLEPTVSPSTFYAKNGNLVPLLIVGFLTAFAFASAVRRLARRTERSTNRPPASTK